MTCCLRFGIPNLRFSLLYYEYIKLLKSKYWAAVAETVLYQGLSYQVVSYLTGSTVWSRKPRQKPIQKGKVFFTFFLFLVSLLLATISWRNNLSYSNNYHFSPLHGSISFSHILRYWLKSYVSQYDWLKISAENTFECYA